MTAPAPEPGDLLIAAKGYGFPAVQKFSIGPGRGNWASALERMSPEQRLALWQSDWATMQRRAITDADRLHRLRVAKAATPRPATHRSPTEAHLREVRLAIEKITGCGEYARYQTPCYLPLFSIVWDDPEIYGHPTRLAATGVHSDGSVVVYLRSDIPLARLHRTALHEFAHVIDHTYFAALPNHQHPVFEARAEETADRLAWL